MKKLDYWRDSKSKSRDDQPHGEYLFAQLVGAALSAGFPLVFFIAAYCNLSL
jgi:hypothetical protein